MQNQQIQCGGKGRTWSVFLSTMPSPISKFLMLVLMCSVINADKIHSDTQAMMYLSEYGYLSASIRNSMSENLMSEDALTKAVQEFQAFANLDVTGRLDNQTLYTMSLPRCGVRDKVGASNTRSKRYALQGSRWKVKDITYRISKYPRGLSKTDTDEEVARAFAVWSKVTPLTFTRRSSGQVHIDIRFESGEHGDGDSFDGPGGTLAHAFFPIYGGDAHFDDSEKWSIRSFKGTNLFQVASHEFGHSLGLSHSDVRSALMAPFYRGYDSSFELDVDDIEAIQNLYGQKTENDAKILPAAGEEDRGKGLVTSPRPVIPSTRVPATESDSELCSDGSIDAILTTADSLTYVFKGSNYWRLTDDGIAAGYPKSISSSWPGLPGNIDTAFSYKNGKTYFFKGSKYWKYDGKKLDGDYPKDISEGFAGIPDNIQAAMVWGGNGKIYFFKGSKFWRFDPSQKQPVKSTYPKPISNWEGVPENLDDALQYKNGYTYFFKRGQYWRFNDKNFAVDQTDPPFPRNAGYWWFGCRTESKNYLKTYPSEYRPTSGDIENERKDNQNTDVGDIVFDAAAKRRMWNRTAGR